MPQATPRWRWARSCSSSARGQRRGSGLRRTSAPSICRWLDRAGRANRGTLVLRCQAHARLKAPCAVLAAPSRWACASPQASRSLRRISGLASPRARANSFVLSTQRTAARRVESLRIRRSDFLTRRVEVGAQQQSRRGSPEPRPESRRSRARWAGTASRVCRRSSWCSRHSDWRCSAQTGTANPGRSRREARELRRPLRARALVPGLRGRAPRGRPPGPIAVHSADSPAADPLFCTQ